MLLSYTSFFQSVLNQFQQTGWLEWIGTISGFICIYLAAKENIWNWPVSIVSVLAYSIVFYESQLFGDAALQIYFLGTAFYGWYFWLYKKEKHEKPIEILTFKQWLFVGLSILILTGLLYAYLKNFTKTDVPLADSFCTSMSFVAQLLMTRKILQSWILWIIVDICYVPLYLHKHLALTTVLYVALIVLAIIGYLDWKKTYKLQFITNEN